MGSLLKNLLHLLFPAHCYHCKTRIEDGFLCAKCLKEIELTNDHLYPTSSQCFVRLSEIVPIKFAMSMCFFRQGNPIQTLIHELKYCGKKKIGLWLGELYGSMLSKYAFAQSFDLIIPIPLHAERKKNRGYNQSAVFGQGLGEMLGKEVRDDIVVRIKHTESQTSKHRTERFENVKDVFQVKDPLLVKGRNILLVDDTITTGATLSSCAKTLLKCQAKSISVVTIAIGVD